MVPVGDLALVGTSPSDQYWDSFFSEFNEELGYQASEKRETDHGNDDD